MGQTNDIKLNNSDLFTTDGNGKKTTTDTLEIENQVSLPEIEESPDSKSVPPKKVPLSENALTVLKKRYLIKNDKGEPIETPEELFLRVAKFVATADKLYDSSASLKKTETNFYNLMANLEFLPNSPTLMNAGRELGQLSACFVLPVEDSMTSIFEAVKNTALIHKSGGGTGFSFSRLRPKNDMVRSTHGIASGPISFMQVFDSATETVKQGGTRRGANMAIMRVDHPDILDFIYAKDEDDKLNNFNISVGITEDFWNALEKEQDYDLINPVNNEKVKSISATDVFKKIVDHAWKNGDPGVVFIDKVNDHNPTPHLGEYESTNPCGEQPLLPFESCNLGSINLAKMVKKEGDKTVVDYAKLTQTVHTAVHFLDNIIDLNKFPIKKIEENTKRTRKIGLGVMGFADMLIHMGIPYNSEIAIETASDVMKFIDDEARKKSLELAVKRGPFPTYKGSIYDNGKGSEIRNATRTTIAPTGTISIIAGCSGGIEPLFALSFTRNVMDNNQLPEIHPVFCEQMKERGFYSEDLIRQVAQEGSVQEIDNVPEDIKKTFTISHEISPEWHIRMQAAFQAHTNNAVSKTVNFANSATREDVSKVYKLAHDLDCKGVTIYRDGSRDVQVLNKGVGKKTAEAAPKPQAGRPRFLQGFTSKLNTGQGSLYVTINTNEETEPVEIFANIGKSGGDTAALSEAIGRLISIALQSGVPVEELSHTLIGITGSRPVWNEGMLVKSVPDGIGQILLSQFGNKDKDTNKETADSAATVKLSAKSFSEAKSKTKLITGPECPDCSNPMETSGGCAVCNNCGYSHCG